MIVRRYATCSPPKFPCVPRISIFAFSLFYLTLINGLLLLLLWERERNRRVDSPTEWTNDIRTEKKTVDIDWFKIWDTEWREDSSISNFDSIKIEKFIENDWFSTSGRDSKKSSPKNSSIAVRLLNSANNYSLKKREKKKERYMEITGKRTNIISSVCT